jgi:cysteine desulfurase
MDEPIYLDHNASTPIAPEVAEAMRPFLTQHFGNPHTLHWAGKPAGDAIGVARRQVAACIGCEPEEVFFTGGATESNNWAIKGAYFANRDRGEHFIASAVEHPSITKSLQWLESRFGARVTWLPVDRFGMVNPQDVEQAITPRTLLITILHAQNEVGTIEPIAEIARIARARQVAFHCDAAQSLGKIPVDVGELGVDLLTIAGHKLYAPKGIGALYVRRGSIRLDPLVHGAGQEADQRGGTENVAYIAGLGAACELAHGHDSTALRELRDYFWQRLSAVFGDRVTLHGHPDQRLPNTLNVGFRGVAGSDLLDRLSGIAASPGAACHHGDVRLSAVLNAMKVDPAYGVGAVRWSLGRSTTREQIDAVIGRLERELPAEGDRARS